MKLSLVLFVLAITAGGFAQDAAQPEETNGISQDNIVMVTGSTTPPAASTPSASSEGTSPSPSPAPSSEATSPSPSPTTASSEAPSPSPTTPSPSPSPSPTTEQSSAAPTTPSPNPSSSTGAPVPDPPAFPTNVGNWSVYNGASPCILVSAAIQIHLTEADSPDTVIDVPNTLDHVNVTGHCNPDRQTLIINWWSKIAQGERENTLRLEFSVQPDNQYALSAVSFKLLEETPDVSRNKSAQVAGQFFLTSLNHSFQCIANQRVETEEASVLYLLTENLQFEAFRDRNSNGTTATPASEESFRFSKAEQCKADQHMSTGTLLFVAIGIGLLIIGGIALTVYLIKRCRRSDYQRLDAQS